MLGYVINDIFKGQLRSAHFKLFGRGMALVVGRLRLALGTR